jgi:hypothetical protein
MENDGVELIDGEAASAVVSSLESIEGFPGSLASGDCRPFNVGDQLTFRLSSRRSGKRQA